MRTIPTADEVACAVIAVCRRCGIDPLDLVAGGHPPHHVRARSLAVALLGERFSLGTGRLAKLVGRGGILHKAAGRDLLATVRPEFDRLLASHAGWEPPVAAKVARALAADAAVGDEPRAPVGVPPDPALSPAPPPTRASEPLSRPARTLVSAPPVGRRPSMVPPADSSKARLQRMLARAVANTAAMDAKG